jgi:hypothetical protein
MRRKIEPLSAWKTEKRFFIEVLLRDLLDTKPEPAVVDVMLKKFGAVVEFSIFSFALVLDRKLFDREELVGRDRPVSASLSGNG